MQSVFKFTPSLVVCKSAKDLICFVFSLPQDKILTLPSESLSQSVSTHRDLKTPQRPCDTSTQ